MMGKEAGRSGQTIRLSEKLVFSQRFKPLYAQGMQLVEEAATYLDGDGRTAAKGMSRVVSTLYAAESMRLTTRLMQVASWLLLQRAANSGEMTREQVAAEKSKVKLDTSSAMDSEGWDGLPEAFRDLVRRSLDMQRLVKRMDADLYDRDALPLAQDSNPVSSQINLLRTAFGGH